MRKPPTIKILISLGFLLVLIIGVGVGRVTVDKEQDHSDLEPLSQESPSEERSAQGRPTQITVKGQTIPLTVWEGEDAIRTVLTSEQMQYVMAHYKYDIDPWSSAPDHVTLDELDELHGKAVTEKEPVSSWWLSRYLPGDPIFLGRTSSDKCLYACRWNLLVLEIEQSAVSFLSFFGDSHWDTALEGSQRDWWEEKIKVKLLNALRNKYKAEYYAEICDQYQSWRDHIMDAGFTSKPLWREWYYDLDTIYECDAGIRECNRELLLMRVFTLRMLDSPHDPLAEGVENWDRTPLWHALSNSDRSFEDWDLHYRIELGWEGDGSIANG